MISGCCTDDCRVNRQAGSEVSEIGCQHCEGAERNWCRSCYGIEDKPAVLLWKQDLEYWAQCNAVDGFVSKELWVSKDVSTTPRLPGEQVRIQVDVAGEDPQAAKRQRMPSMLPEPWESLPAIRNTHRYGQQMGRRDDLLTGEKAFADPDRLVELLHHSDTGSLQMASPARPMKQKQAITLQMLKDELQALEAQRVESARNHQLITEAQWSPPSTFRALEQKADATEPTCPMAEDDFSTTGSCSPPESNGSPLLESGSPSTDDTENSLEYWKDLAKRTAILLDESTRREQLLIEIWEHLIVLREEAAVQMAAETELNKTLHVAEDTMRAKQIVATMSHEIRSPLSGVISMGQVLWTTKLDTDQRKMLKMINDSGAHVRDLINDILDLSKAGSGAMKLEAKKFRPRQIVKYVLQSAAASNPNKNTNLVGQVADEVPEEVVGDVLKIRQVLTNLVSNAVKFTPKGEVSVKVRLSSPPVVNSDSKEPFTSTNTVPCSRPSGAVVQTQSPSIEHDSDEPDGKSFRNDPIGDGEFSDISRSSSSISSVSSLSSVSSATLSTSSSFNAKSPEDAKVEEDVELQSTFPAIVWNLPPTTFETTEAIWLHCEVTDTGIGIPESALPTLFEEYTQASTTTARKYGGTGLGLAICKHLVGLMSGTLDVKSKQYAGSSFSFTLPLRSVKAGTKKAAMVDSDHLRPVVYTGVSEGKGKPRKGAEVKLKQMGRDPKRFWTPIKESPLSGHGKGVPEVPKEEDEVLPSRNDPTVSISSQVPASEISENLKTGCTSAASLKSNVAMKNTNSLRIATPSQSADQEAAPQSPLVSPSSRRSPRILLAEDNRVNVVVVQSMLRRLGLSLEVVSNGKEAVDALKRNDYDLVLMDVSMPVMDGLEATRLIRLFEKTGEGRIISEEPVAVQCTCSSDTVSQTVPQVRHSVADPILRTSRRGRTPIIALTANAMADNVQECYNHGMDSFIAKPITFEELEKVFKEYIPWSEHRRVQAR